MSILTAIYNFILRRDPAKELRAVPRESDGLPSTVAVTAGEPEATIRSMEANPTTGESMPPASLVFRTGPNAGQRIPILRARTRIGRGNDNDIVVDDPTVSRRHATINYASGAFEITDTGSIAGTRLGEVSVVADARIKSGDVIRIGETEMAFASGRSDATMSRDGNERDIQSVESTLHMDLKEQIPSIWLAVIDGPDMGQTKQINNGVTVIGRGEDCDLQLTDAKVSRRHAGLITSEGSISLFDLGSSSGTLLNGTEVEGKELDTGSVLKLGNTQLALVAVARKAANADDTSDPRAGTIMRKHVSTSDTAGVLVVQSGPDAGKSISLAEGPNYIGRQRCEVLLTDPTVSRVHAVIRRDLGSIRVFDLASSAGTVVDGRRLAGKEVKAGDIIEIGGSKLAIMEPGLRVGG